MIQVRNQRENFICNTLLFGVICFFFGHFFDCIVLSVFSFFVDIVLFLSFEQILTQFIINVSFSLISIFVFGVILIFVFGIW